MSGSLYHTLPTRCQANKVGRKNVFRTENLYEGNSQNARISICEALECFERSSQTEPDPYADPSVIDSCRQLLSECDGPLHPADYYWQWLI